MATENLKSHKSPCTDQIPAELIKAEGKTIRCEIHKHVNSIWNKEELPEEWKESIIVVFIIREMKQSVVITEAYNFRQLRTKFHPTSFCQG